ncbi:MAG: tRNA (guanosine(46)-N7)-methyltransferase TrmB [Magnetococcales bacterium]|nr:tRNA (guanosine(46)-N7)-methyltransferase TrmB [Magnetococcales bacterium]
MSETAGAEGGDSGGRGESDPVDDFTVDAGASEERGRLKIHGRKKGRLKTREVDWLLDTLPRYQIPKAGDRRELMGLLGADPDSGRLVLEIGFGNGLFLTDLAKRYPGDRFIGIDVFLEGVAGLIRKVEPAGLTNVRISKEPAQSAIVEEIPPTSLDRVIINFPDPWPKKRHHKRRLIQPEFLDCLALGMRQGGLLSLATDWAEYGEWMLEMLEKHPCFANQVGSGCFAPEPEGWIETRFQEKGLAAGRGTHHLLYAKVADPPKR